MKLILRQGEREAEQDIPLPAPFEESFRRIKIAYSRNPQAVLAHQVTQEIKYLMERDNLLGQLVSDLVQHLDASADITINRRNFERPRDSGIRAIGSDSGDSFHGEEPESCITRSNVG